MGGEDRSDVLRISSTQKKVPSFFKYPLAKAHIMCGKLELRMKYEFCFYQGNTQHHRRSLRGDLRPPSVPLKRY